MIELYKDGDDMGMMTECPDENTFVSELATLLSDMIDSDCHEHDWEFQLDHWLPAAFEIIASFRGYKTQCVIRARRYMGVLFPMEHSIVRFDGRTTQYIPAPMKRRINEEEPDDTPDPFAEVETAVTETVSPTTVE